MLFAVDDYYGVSFRNETEPWSAPPTVSFEGGTRRGEDLQG